jgi:hypothetical protein
MLTIQFGDQHPAVTFRDDPSTVGDYALHVQCPWHWFDASGVVRAHKPDQIEPIASQLLLCISATAGDDGSFCLSFEDGSTLQVEPDEASGPCEHWRLFEPTRDTAHFVVTDRGVHE